MSEHDRGIADYEYAERQRLREELAAAHERIAQLEAVLRDGIAAMGGHPVEWYVREKWLYGARLVVERGRSR